MSRLAVIAVVAACSYPEPSAPTIAIAGGDGQSAASFSVLAPLVVATRDESGEPVPGATVSFEVIEGSSMLTNSVGVTDATGLASATLRLDAGGTTRVRASADGFTGSPLEFVVDAIPAFAQAFATQELAFEYAFADFNLDGTLDYSVGDDGSAKLSVKTNRTSVGEDEPTVDSFGTDIATRTFDHVAADFDGDGKADIVTVSLQPGANEILLFRNTTTQVGTFTPTFATGEAIFTFAAFSTATSALVTADIDRDGKPDLVGLNQSASNGFIVLTNDTPFRLTKFAAPEALAARTVATGDFDGDGGLDVALNGAEGLVVYRNTTPQAAATPSFAEEVTIAISNNEVAIGDLDGDGLDDLVVSHGGSDVDRAVLVYLATTPVPGAPLAFAEPVRIPIDFAGPVTVNDFDGDGRIDFAIFQPGLVMFRNVTPPGAPLGFVQLEVPGIGGPRVSSARLTHGPKASILAAMGLDGGLIVTNKSTRLVERCTIDDDCRVSTDVCNAGACIPGPGATGGLGATCAANEECASGRCDRVESEERCVTSCLRTASLCPAGFACVDDSCRPAEPEGSGGCAAVPHPSLLLAALLLVAARRRLAAHKITAGTSAGP